MPIIGGLLILLGALIAIYLLSQKKCVRCKKRIGSRTTHCTHCGAKQYQPCARCGHVVTDPEQEFCDNCGTRIYWRFDNKN